MQYNFNVTSDAERVAMVVVDLRDQPDTSPEQHMSFMAQFSDWERTAQSQDTNIITTIRSDGTVSIKGAV
jgi:hypothetical protein